MIAGLLLVGLFCAGPLLAAWFFASFLFYDPAYGFSAASALLAFGSLCISPLLSGRYRLMERLGGTAFWYRRHMLLPLAILLLSLLHYLVRLSYFPRGLQTSGGEIAFWLLIAGVANALLILGFPLSGGRLRHWRDKIRRRIPLPYSTARLMHNLLLAVIALVTLHIAFSSLASIPAMRLVILCYGCSGLLLGLWPKLRRRLCKRLTWKEKKSSAGGISCFMLDSRQAFGFKPGQYGFFRLHGRDAQGKKLSGEPHPFSFTGGSASAGDSQTTYQASICVKALGDYTRHLQELQPPVNGSWEGPFGTFQPPESGDCLMIAGGIGITPFLSWLEHFAQAGRPGNYRLLWTMKTEGELFCRDQLEGRAAKAGVDLRLHYSGADDSQRLTDVQLRAALDGLKQPHIYLCGPPAFMRALSLFFRKHGIARDRLHTENFSL